MVILEMDSEVAAALTAVKGSAPTLGADALDELRSRLIRGVLPSHAEGIDRAEYVVSGPPDSPAVMVRVHVPSRVETDAACLFHIHGGGYVLGTRLMDDARFDRWCPNMGLIGVSVEYRLSPETPFPGPLEDCYAGLQWVFDHSGRTWDRSTPDRNWGV